MSYLNTYIFLITKIFFWTLKYVDFDGLVILTFEAEKFNISKLMQETFEQVMQI